MTCLLQTSSHKLYDGFVIDLHASSQYVLALFIMIPLFVIDHRLSHILFILCYGSLSLQPVVSHGLLVADTNKGSIRIMR
jgi:hypothetical protein